MKVTSMLLSYYDIMEQMMHRLNIKYIHPTRSTQILSCLNFYKPTGNLGENYLHKQSVCKHVGLGIMPLD